MAEEHKPLERSVAIQIDNKTYDATLHSPRSYCFSGFNTTPPSPKIPPGASGNCQFVNSRMCFRGAVGVLVYEAETFTLAILFSNPFDYNLYSIEFAMEISLHKAHQGNLKDIYTRMFSGQPASVEQSAAFHRVKLGECQEPVKVSAGHVKAMATMSNAAKSIIKVIVENEDCLSK